MNIYFIGIGGSGISALANLALDCGYNFWGSDREKSLNTKLLEEANIDIDYNQDGKFLEKINQKFKIDLVIYSAGVPKNSPELETANKLGIKIKKRDYFINQIIKDKNLKLIAVAGTHGKTTTSAMAVWTFKKLGIPISYAIGSNISFGKSAKYDINSEYFVYEADEFDRNFLHFNPDYSIITSIDFDHGDIYKDQKDYFNAFEDFLKKSQETFIFERDKKKLNIDYPKVIHSLSTDNSEILNLIGKHNRENAYLVLKNISKIFDKKKEVEENLENKIVQALNSFPGTQRRMEKIKERVFTDYAHHPKEIEATIQASKEVFKEIIVIYQPHQNIRQHSIKDGYKEAFKFAKKVYWLETYLTREPKGIPILSPLNLSKDIQNTEIIISKMDQDLKSKLELEYKSGGLILFMGAGSIDNWAREFVKSLS